MITWINTWGARGETNVLGKKFQIMYVDTLPSMRGWAEFLTHSVWVANSDFLPEYSMGGNNFTVIIWKHYLSQVIEVSINSGKSRGSLHPDRSDVKKKALRLRGLPPRTHSPSPATRAHQAILTEDMLQTACPGLLRTVKVSYKGSLRTVTAKSRVRRHDD